MKTFSILCASILVAGALMAQTPQTPAPAKGKATAAKPAAFQQDVDPTGRPSSYNKSKKDSKHTGTEKNKNTNKKK